MNSSRLRLPFKLLWHEAINSHYWQFNKFLRWKISFPVKILARHSIFVIYLFLDHENRPQINTTCGLNKFQAMSRTPESYCKGKQVSICNWLSFLTCGNSWASLNCIYIYIQYFNLNQYFHENILTSFYPNSSTTFVFIVKFKIWKNNWKLIPAIKNRNINYFFDPMSVQFKKKTIQPIQSYSNLVKITIMNYV